MKRIPILLLCLGALLSAKDADLSFPNAATVFSCALGVPIDKEHTPHLYLLLQRTLADAGLSTYTAKNHYRRLQPFVLNNQPICTRMKRSCFAKMAPTLPGTLP